MQGMRAATSTRHSARTQVRTKQPAYATPMHVPTCTGVHLRRHVRTREIRTPPACDPHVPNKLPEWVAFS